MIDSFAQAAITVLFGAIAGGVTNAVAIRMLFHPRQPPIVFGRPLRFLHGAIPKNQARLARALGRTVATQLLTPSDLERMLLDPAFRRAFDERLAGAIRDALDRSLPSLRRLLPPALAAELEALAAEARAPMLARLDDYLASPAFLEQMRTRIAALAAELAERPIEDVLTAERERSLAESVDRWIGEAVEAAGFERTVRESVDHAAGRLLEGDRTFEQVLPSTLVAATERAIAGWLPILLERLGRMLEEPDARARVQRTLHDILDRFMRDLKFHQRIVAAVLVTPETIDRVLKAIEQEGAQRIAELLHETEVREAMTRGVRDAVADFLARPVTSVFGEPGDDSVEGAKRTAVDAALRIAREPATREFLVGRLRGALVGAERRTWGELFRRMPPERMAEPAVDALRSERARALYAEALERLTSAALDRPIGRPLDRLPDDAPARIEAAVAEPVWHWLSVQVPLVAQRVDIAARVEEKVLVFPPEQLEELVRGVIERELVLIVRMGYVLGAVVGLALVGVTALLG